MYHVLLVKRCSHQVSLQLRDLLDQLFFASVRFGNAEPQCQMVTFMRGLNGHARVALIQKNLAAVATTHFRFCNQLQTREQLGTVRFVVFVVTNWPINH